MSVLVKDMKMPTTGLYFVGVDDAGGRDKTVVTVERMLGNRDVRQIVGSFELVPVPPHGRLIDADALISQCKDEKGSYYSFQSAVVGDAVESASTVIEAEDGKE